MSECKTLPNYLNSFTDLIQYDTRSIENYNPTSGDQKRQSKILHSYKMIEFYCPWKNFNDILSEKWNMLVRMLNF